VKRRSRVLWVLGALLVAGVFLQNRFGTVARVRRLWPLIRFAAVRADVDPHLLAALVHAESSGDPAAGRAGGAVGLLQLTPAAARDAAGGRAVEAAELRRPERALELGAAYLAGLLARFGEERLGLAAYRLGPTRIAREVEAAGGPAPFLRAFDHHPAAFYVAKVQGLKRLYRRLEGE
jgi:soluble lytic murein transglycosylase-like protein